MRRLLPMVLLLAACAAPVASPGLRSVKLSQEALTLTLTNGTRCWVDWRQAPVGRMEACGQGYGYAVTVADNPNVLRQLVEGVVLALGASAVLAPMAEVVITGPGGTDQIYRFPER
ncbi:hypothetical protein Q9295_12920 [Xinfangfangia sp. CPCC 101601]|uniref:Lipoprotein n=1 Tax=Pseudogemmobacter lacusdianii TaxID=3069608 RepID=A0ABU0VZT6_9RHOB|nr:hypothetical protein [Xinfangfangia sp. CPCC 101601]MDQ2067272.1 hypothetical protein [Xinfangfangia sp. CPCC 101601]